MLRALSIVFLLPGIAVFAVDLYRWLVVGEGFRLSALGEIWAYLHRDSLLLLQPAIERHITPALWDPGVQTLLEWPAAVEFAALAVAFWLLGQWRRRRRARR